MKFPSGLTKNRREIDDFTMLNSYDVTIMRNMKPQPTPTQLFTIRVWAEKLEDGIHEWRGKVQKVSEDEGHYFRGWQDLVELLQTLVSDDEE